MEPFWERISGPGLAQGDFLGNCPIPIMQPDFSAEGATVGVPVADASLIIVTQSCDLENKKVKFVALCPIHTLPEWEEVNPNYKKAKSWEEVRKGRVEGLHLLASPVNPENNLEAFVVDFGHIISLPFDYLTTYAASAGERWRLRSPFLEHFSQAFARFFMRVGLPSTIPSYK